jgi:hypothetical protein
VNLAYISKSIRYVSLLTRLRSHSYKKSIDPQNRVSKPRITMKILINTNQVMSEASTSKIKQKEQLRISNIFHRISDVHDQELGKLKTLIGQVKRGATAAGIEARTKND